MLHHKSVNLIKYKSNQLCLRNTIIVLCMIYNVYTSQSRHKYPYASKLM